MKIIVTSKNPVKVEAVKEAFQKVFNNNTITIDGLAVPSGVSDQPLSDQETITGAMNRLNNAMSINSKADYYVSIEAGINDIEGEMYNYAWVFIKNRENKLGKSKTDTFVLPSRVRELILEGKELGKADDIVFGHTNSKQTIGSIGILTNNLITRTSYYTEAIILALIPFMNSELY